MEKEFSFDTCKQLFLAHLERQGYSMETYDGYQKDLECFRRFVLKGGGTADFSLACVGRKELLGFMDDGRRRGNKASTVSRRLSTLKSFYKFLIFELDYPIDVAARIRTPKVFVPLQNILSEDEVKRLLSCAKRLAPCYHLIFSALYYTGSRLSPIRTLERRHVMLEQRVIYFPKVKGGKDLHLPLHDRLRDLFEHYFEHHLSQDEIFVFPSKKIPSQPLSASDIRNKLRVAAQYANLDPSITPHTLRHCTATHLTVNHVPQRTIANILGHADLRSTMRYQHLSVEHMRDPLNQL